MIYKIFADFVIILHLLFILFALFGAFLALKWKKTIWIHLPAALWAMAVEFANLPCPLTPIEKWLIERQGRAAYGGGFVEHYILSMIYPGQLESSTRLLLGTVALMLNVGFYAWILKLNSKNVLK